MLQPEKYYHIYSHANGNDNLFIEEKNYYFFLQLIEKHLLEYINIYAYCLMPNHFHLAISVKSVDELLNFFKFNKIVFPPGEEELYYFIQKKISKVFSNLFSSYTQSFNKVYERKGSLFIPNFKSVEVNDDNHFCNLIYYIHKNPVHHGFVKDIEDWQYSSYNKFLKQKPLFIDKNKVIEMFGCETNFINYHKQEIELKSKLEN